MRLNAIVRSILWFNDKVTDDPLERVLYRQLEEHDYHLYNLGHDERRLVERMIYVSSIEWGFRLLVTSTAIGTAKIFRDRKAKRLTGRAFMIWYGANLLLSLNVGQYLGYIFFVEKEPEFSLRLRERYV